ncbi:MAG: sensor histidine kinase [Gammaproteobacteria bacterium]|nr:sensor histidine kinase [Gammaproteobacteria bacterium]
MNSLERSLQLGLTVSLLLFMLVFWWAVSLASQLLTESFVFSRLENEALNVNTALQLRESDLTSAQVNSHRLSPDYDKPVSGKYFWIRFKDGTELLSRSAWEQPQLFDQLAAGEQRRIRTEGLAGEPLLLWLGGFSREGQEFTLGIAEDFSAIKARLAVFRWYFALMAGLLLAALLSVQHMIVKRSVKKLEVIREDIKRLEHGLAVSVTEDVPTEVLPLVREFNRLLVRFEQRLRQSRNAVGNLAHALKGPLNLLMRDSRADGTATDTTMVAQNAERIHTLIESELKRARLAGRSAAGQRFDLEAELPSLCGLLEQVYSEKGVDVRVNISPHVELKFDRQDMLELIGNLLDNAVKWAKSVVMVSVRSNDGIYLDIEDDGPGCTPAECRMMMRRGVRLDESVAGHGLGLSIVKDIVDTYNGTLEFSSSQRLGGLQASVYLPHS